MNYYYTIYTKHDSSLALPEYNHVEVYYLYTLAGTRLELVSSAYETDKENHLLQPAI